MKIEDKLLTFKKITILIPTRNEEKHIHAFIKSIIQQDYPKNKMEVFMIDGMSIDKTQEIIQKLNKQYPFIRLIKNERKIVPTALNIGIKLSKGDIIIRMDAHAVYPNNYISELIKYLEKLNADNVGGVWITTPINSTLKAQSIALITSNSFGIGNAMYRLKPKEIIEVDTVPFGCYKREVFEKIGLFDEQLIRNQDDEFNARIKKNGGKIFLIPSIKIIYFARENFKKMYKMFFQYGLFKPLVYKKIKKPATIRQFAPLFFVIYLFIFPIQIFISIKLFFISSIPVLLYILFNMIVSINISTKKMNFKLLPYLISGFFLVHFSYGCGYLLGIFKFLINNKNKTDKEINTNR